MNNWQEMLKEHRKSLFLNKTQMAKRMGINPGHYINIENGKVEPTDTTLEKIVKHLELDYTIKKTYIASTTSGKSNSFFTSVPSFFAKKVGIEKGDLYDMYVEDNKIIIEKKRTIIKGEGEF